MYLTIKETLVGENVTSSLCESYPISTQQYTQYSGFVESGGNSYLIYSNGTIIWICPLYSVCVIDSTCNHYYPIHFLPMPRFLHGKDPTTHLKAKSQRNRQIPMWILFWCSVFRRLLQPVAFIELGFAFRYSVLCMQLLWITPFWPDIYIFC